MVTLYPTPLHWKVSLPHKLSSPGEDLEKPNRRHPPLPSSHPLVLVKSSLHLPRINLKWVHLCQVFPPWVFDRSHGYPLSTIPHHIAETPTIPLVAARSLRPPRLSLPSASLSLRPTLSSALFLLHFVHRHCPFDRFSSCPHQTPGCPTCCQPLCKIKWCFYDCISSQPLVPKDITSIFTKR